MRKLKLLCLCGLTAAVLMTGCAGSTDTTNVNLGSATVSEYRGVKINVAAPEVTDDEVDQKIQTNLKQNPNEVEVDRAAQDGDIVNIIFSGETLACGNVYTDTLKVIWCREVFVNNLKENLKALAVDSGAHHNRYDVAFDNMCS